MKLAELKARLDRMVGLDESEVVFQIRGRLYPIQGVDLYDGIIYILSNMDATDIKNKLEQ